MTAIDPPTSVPFAAPVTWRSDVALGVVVSLFAFGVHAASGFPTLSSLGGDNDSMLRLVQIRDLIAGQGWFDLHQYRMGLDGGFVMHWSRLVDAPIAGIMLAVAALTGSMALGETVAIVVWPLLLMAAAMALMLRIARALGGDWTVLPILTVGGAALHFVGIFAPAVIDHHNVQLVLALAAVAALATGRGSAAGFAAGAASALMLAVGMETAPYVAVAGTVAAIGFLSGTAGGAEKASGFGWGFSAVGLAVFVATVPADAWFAAQCDAYSIPQFAAAAIAGGGLAVAAGLAPLRRSPGRRAGALVTLAAAVAAVMVVFFPQCLAAPYADLDPRLKTFWLDSVSEAQPFWSLLLAEPAKIVVYYATPLLGIAVLGSRLRSAGPVRVGVVVMAFLGMAFAVSIWQVRGSMFSIPLAAIPLAAWVGGWRRRVAAGGGGPATLRMALAWLASFNVVWAFAASAVAVAVGPAPPGAVATKEGCTAGADLAALAAMPATTVLAVSNLGAPILGHTRHRVLAGPYHRNVAGNLAALDALMGQPSEARGIVERGHVGLVVVCPGNSETVALSRWAPSGLAASLAAGALPDWLERVPAAGPLEIYRVKSTP